MFLQVGYGLEGVLPDATSFDITERHIKPRFRNNDYEGGLSTGIDLIFQAIRGEYKGTGRTKKEGENRSGGGSGLLTSSFAWRFFVHDPARTPAKRIWIFEHGRPVYRRMVGRGLVRRKLFRGVDSVVLAGAAGALAAEAPAPAGNSCRCERRTFSASSTMSASFVRSRKRRQDRPVKFAFLFSEENWREIR